MPLRLQQCTLHFQKPLIFFFWTRKVKRVALCLVYHMLSFIPIGLLHNIANVCNQNSLIVYLRFESKYGHGFGFLESFSDANSYFEGDLKGKINFQRNRILEG